MGHRSCGYRVIKLFDGLSIYKTSTTTNWMMRVWDVNLRQYVIKSSGQHSVVAAKKEALRFVKTVLTAEPILAEEHKFTAHCLMMLAKETKRAHKGERSIGSVKAMRWCIEAPGWGMLDRFGARDIRKIGTADFVAYMGFIDQQKPHWAPSNKNTILATFRNIMKNARDQGVISTIPETPRAKQQDNPRPFFRFYPLVKKQDDEVQTLIHAARQMAKEKTVVRWLPITEELADVLEFIIYTFVRPIASELYALRHRDIAIADDPKRLILTIRDGKTGRRISNSMPQAVDIYRRCLARHPGHSDDDYIFYPTYQNRITAGKNIQRQFKFLMEKFQIVKIDGSQKPHSLYSLRHTAICMRIIHSEGQVNIFNLAKNAGTSVDQIERFYARNLPLSAEMARNLQS